MVSTHSAGNLHCSNSSLVKRLKADFEKAFLISDSVVGFFFNKKKKKEKDGGRGW